MIVEILIDNKIINPPIDGVPCFFKWVSGAYLRIFEAPLCIFFNHLINSGVTRNDIHNAVINAPPVRTVI